MLAAERRGKAEVFKALKGVLCNCGHFDGYREIKIIYFLNVRFCKNYF